MTLHRLVWAVHERLRGRRSFALDGIDVALAERVGLRDGVFLEAGANDGLAQSNTYYLERYLGWRGVLVEPSPPLAARCRRNRPYSRVFNCALVPEAAPGARVTLRGSGLMAAVDEAFASPADREAFLAEARRVEGREPVVWEVPARTLDDVIDEAAPGGIDLMSLDVEGYEAAALRGLDLGRHAPRRILVETAHDGRDEILDLLGTRYELEAELSHHLRYADLLFRRRDEAAP